MRFLPLCRRAELIRRKYGIRLGRKHLARIYKRNGIRYLQAKTAKRQAPEREEELEADRIAFARKLKSLEGPRTSNRIIHMDQTTFISWPKPGRTWFPPGKGVLAPQNKDFLSSVTLYGAIGQCLKGGKLYMIAEGTIMPEFKRFLGKLAQALKNPYGWRPYLVLDNHSSHTSH